MATQSSSATTGVGSSSAPMIVQIVPTTLNPEVWQHYNLCKMTDGSTKAQSLKTVPEAGQSSMARDESLFVYNPDVVRE
ncbi:hypothetical protein Tco_0623128 [Tanacetum coccineum]